MDPNINKTPSTNEHKRPGGPKLSPNLRRNPNPNPGDGVIFRDLLGTGTAFRNFALVCCSWRVESWQLTQVGQDLIMSGFIGGAINETSGS